MATKKKAAPAKKVMAKPAAKKVAPAKKIVKPAPKKSDSKTSCKKNGEACSKKSSS